MIKTITTKQKRRMYALHKNLRGTGNIVNARSRDVIKRAETVSAKEAKWIDELIDLGYCVRNNTFYD